jgi:hypothetical protein
MQLWIFFITAVTESHMLIGPVGDIKAKKMIGWRRWNQVGRGFFLDVIRC